MYLHPDLLFLKKVIAFGRKLVYGSSLHIQECSQIRKDNIFLRDVLAAWCKINASEIKYVIAKEIIWNN